MAQIFPFQGLRYNTRTVKNTAKVFAPPYDVISPAHQQALYRRHPQNIVRLILGKIQPGDDRDNNRYSRAKRLLEQWIKKNILAFDELPSLYVYSQNYIVDGRRKERVGFIGRLQLDDAGGCLPHEKTLAKPKEDRLQLIRQVRANLSPIFSFYLDPQRRVSKLVSGCMNRRPLYEVIDEEHVRHRFWSLSDPAVISRIQTLMRDKQIFIADGHHRYEVANTFRKEMLATGYSGKEAYTYVMMYFTEFSESNLCVQPTHRLVRSFPQLKKKLGALAELFAFQRVKSLAQLTKLQRACRGFSVGMYQDGVFSLLRMKDPAQLSRLMNKAPSLWRDLDVAILNTVVFEHVFGLDEARREEYIVYTRDPAEAIREVERGKFKVAFLLNPTKPQQVKDIALAGMRMPQKSTYFYPKPLSGLVINKF